MQFNKNPIPPSQWQWETNLHLCDLEPPPLISSSSILGTTNLKEKIIYQLAHDVSLLFQFAFFCFKIISRGFPFKNENIPTHGRLIEAGLSAGRTEITNTPTAKLGDSKQLSSSFLSLRSASHPLVTNLPDQDCTPSLRLFRRGHCREAVAEAGGRSGGHCKNGPFPLWGPGKLLLYPFNSPGWANNSNDIQQINRRKSTF